MAVREFPAKWGAASSKSPLCVSLLVFVLRWLACMPMFLAGPAYCGANLLPSYQPAHSLPLSLPGLPSTTRLAAACANLDGRWNLSDPERFPLPFPTPLRLAAGPRLSGPTRMLPRVKCTCTRNRGPVP